MDSVLKGWLLVWAGIAMMAGSFGITWGVAAALFMCGLGLLGVGAALVSED